MSDRPLWERRFRAPRLTLPHWSRRAPDRAVYASNVSGVWQVHTLDVLSGRTRQVSDHAVGVLTGAATADGAEVVFWQEDTGDETGRWLAQAWEGGGSEPFLEGVATGWAEGLAQAPGVTAVGISDDDGFAVSVSIDGGPAREIARSQAWLAIAGAYGAPSSDVAGLAADGSLLALQHAEHGDLTHPSLRIVDARTGSVVGERGDGMSAVEGCAWSPVAGDLRLAVVHEPTDRLRTAIWDLASGAWTELDTSLVGDVIALDWWPDGSALLLQHLLDGRHTLHRAELATGTVSEIDTPQGAIDDARVRPDGSVWFSHTDGVHRVRILDDRGREVVTLAEAPPGGAFHDWRFENEHGQVVHGFIVEPEGEGPHPVMIFVHGGPHWLYEDRYMAEVQAYVDMGFLVGMPNYRGSTGYGRAWRDALTGDPGFTDVDDVTAGLRDLLRRPDADPRAR